MNKIIRPALLLLVFTITFLSGSGKTYGSPFPGQAHEEVLPVMDDSLQHSATEKISQGYTGEESHADAPGHADKAGHTSAPAEEHSIEALTGENLAEAEHAGDGHAEGGHQSNMFPLLFIIIALIIGAGTRHFLRKSPLPFTVSLLLIGLGLGAANRLGWFEVWHVATLKINMDFLHQSLNWAGKIDPHLILFRPLGKP